LSFLARNNKRGKKGKIANVFSVTQSNFDNEVSLDVELMKREFNVFTGN